MKPRLTTVAFAILLASSGTAFAAEPTQADKERCFEKHKALMHKPAVQNPRDCWNTHKHLRSDKAQ